MPSASASAAKCKCKYYHVEVQVLPFWQVQVLSCASTSAAKCKCKCCQVQVEELLSASLDPSYTTRLWYVDGETDWKVMYSVYTV